MSKNEQNGTDDMKAAVGEIDEIMKRYDEKIRNKLVSHILSSWLTEKAADHFGLDEVLENENCVDDDFDTGDVLDDPIKTLDNIVASIKPKVPRSGILELENFVQTKKPDDPNATIEIDCFLYDDEDFDILEDKGELSRYYCETCGSKKIKFLNIESHSMSREELFTLFNDTLPVLVDKVVLDVGSRLGAVLYGAYVFTDAEKIIGVEMNKEFCDIQTEVINKFKMNKRIEVINKKIQDCADVLKSADVVVLNNIFEPYLPKEKHAELWYFFKEHIKKGAYIVCRPPIEHAVKDLNLNIDVTEWVKKVEALSFDDNTDEGENETPKIDFPRSGIPCYVVL
ncbi:uncharacterized protein LOC123263697 isoform X1 [Cotesia glomerata]|uniref:Uncharacterized protein n=1 Tax=Cotesia glomerata TaxID=32391 RepID=A0AAV7IM49_COTGL|nr:uncharacterized protein LOC123263697 isoform X1 [Cotesia glomerata]KAH0554217.1 hypothetical protein KQX54_008599 [Cotesia glomerata]